MSDVNAPRVASHELTLRDDVVRVYATSQAALATFGDETLRELTLHAQFRCPLDMDVLGVTACGCADRLGMFLGIARRAPRGVVAYLPPGVDDVETAYLHLGALLGALPPFERIFTPDYRPLEVQVLRDVGYEVVHAPTLFPFDDAAWPGKASRSWDSIKGHRLVRQLRNLLRLT